MMDYCGYDIGKALKKYEFTVDQILLIMYKILSGIHFMHQAKVMHRDLKPANILIDEQFNIKICDFGMSRVDQIESGLKSFKTKLTNSLLQSNNDKEDLFESKGIVFKSRRLSKHV